MEWLSNLSVRRPVLAVVMMLTIVVIGAVGYGSLGVDKFPAVEFPLVTVTTVYPGAAPSAVELDVTDKIEAAVNTVSGIETLSSVSTEGASLVIVQFTLEKNADIAAQEVRDQIAQIRDLPKSAQAPQIRKADPAAAPVLMVALKGDAPVQELTRVAEDVVKRRLETIGGVGQVRIIGGQKRRIEIDLDPIRLASAGVSALEVYRAINVANVSVPGGRLERGPESATMRIEGRVGSPEQIGEIVVRQFGDHAVKVADVATVRDGVADPDSAAVRDGVASVALAIRKQSGSNTVEVVDRTTAAALALAKELPPGIHLDIVRDNADVIRTSASQVTEHLVIGAALAALVVLLFLGSLRSTIIAAVAIPVSIVGTFALMSWAGFTLNMMTLLALALAVGIVIDDAIVVLENIYRHIEEHGMKPFPAAIRATKEISAAVLATTLSLMAVFLPVAFMSGIVGQFLRSFGLTMAFAIAVSMLVSFTLTPMMAARILPLPPTPGHKMRKSWLERGIDLFYAPFERGYGRVLGFLLRHRWIVVVASVGVLATVPVLAKTAGFGFLPENDEAHFEIYLRTKEGTSLEATTLLAERIARNTRKVRDVTHTLVTVADNDQKIQNVANIYVRLSNPALRARSQEDVMDEVRRTVLVDMPPGTRVAAQLVNDFSLGTQQNAIIQYLLLGPDLDRLQIYANRVLDQMRKVPGVVDLDSSLPDALPEQTVRPDLDRAGLLGVDPADITSSLALLMGGMEASNYEERGNQYAVFVRANERFRWDSSLLGLITVPSRTVGQVPLSDLVETTDGTGPSQITRTFRAKSVTITMNVALGHNEGEVTAVLEKAIKDLDLPPGYNALPWGRTREMGRTGAAFAFAFLLSFLFMYLVLAAQFESWLHPFTIMLTLPLTLPFALLSIILFGNHLDIFSMLGLLVLFGVVKKNGILQVDHANQLRARGMPRDQAIVQAGRDRLRPILMTTLAFVAGMVPLIVTKGIGSGFSQAIAGVVVGGQMLSLALTLVAIPVFYSLFDGASASASRVVGRLIRRGPAPDRGERELTAPTSSEHSASSV